MLTGTRKGPAKSGEGATGKPVASPALEWLWRDLQDVRHPHILDCGPLRPATVRVALARRAKITVADLVTPAQRGAPGFWNRSGKQPVFLVHEFLAQTPKVAAGSVSTVFGWQLFDLLPRDSLPVVVERFCQYLAPGGFLYCLLREPYLSAGCDAKWWLEALTSLANTGLGKEPFPYPALSNREVERLVPGRTVKTFLSRSGIREVLIR